MGQTLKADTKILIQESSMCTCTENLHYYTIKACKYLTNIHIKQFFIPCRISLGMLHISYAAI